MGQMVHQLLARRAVQPTVGINQYIHIAYYCSRLAGPKRFGLQVYNTTIYT